jgi:hypothetical protein
MFVESGLEVTTISKFSLIFVGRERRRRHTLVDFHIETLPLQKNCAYTRI